VSVPNEMPTGVAVAILLGLVFALALPAADPSKLQEQVDLELRLLPYISQFDYIEAKIEGVQVVLGGYTVRAENVDEAERTVAKINGVESVVNEIEVLPSSASDRRIRASLYNKMQRQLPRYFRGSIAKIRLVVKNGSVLLKGEVGRPSERDTATAVARSIEGVAVLQNDITVRTESP